MIFKVLLTKIGYALAFVIGVAVTVAFQLAADKQLGDYLYPDEMLTVNTCRQIEAFDNFVVLRDGTRMPIEGVDLTTTNYITGEEITTRASGHLPNLVQVFIKNTGRNALSDIDLYVEFQPQVGDYIDYLVIGSNYRGGVDGLEVKIIDKVTRKIHIARMAKNEILAIEALFYTGASARVFGKTGNFVRFGNEEAPCSRRSEVLESYIPYLEVTSVNGV